jgi:hypothetical protein
MGIRTILFFVGYVVAAVRRDAAALERMCAECL